MFSRCALLRNKKFLLYSKSVCDNNFRLISISKTPVNKNKKNFNFTNCFRTITMSSTSEEVQIEKITESKPIESESNTQVEEPDTNTNIAKEDGELDVCKEQNQDDDVKENDEKPQEKDDDSSDSEEIEIDINKLAERFGVKLSVENEDVSPGVLPQSELNINGISEGIKSGKFKNIILMSGAGISVAAGIPDFRTPGTGLYDNLQKYNLDDPTDIFTLRFFLSF